ncbi:myelin-oligodendrocyte glycoprotein-like, partial [Huso huso]
GEDVVLNCHVELPPPDLEVQWTRADNDMLVHLYVEGGDLPPHYQYRGRTELFYEEIPNGNVSLKLHKVTLRDRGSYRCTVSAQGLSGEAVVELTVAGE